MTNKLNGRKGLVAAILVGTTMLSAPVQAVDLMDTAKTGLGIVCTVVKTGAGAVFTVGKIGAGLVLLAGGATVAGGALFSKETINLLEKIDAPAKAIRALENSRGPIVGLGCAAALIGYIILNSKNSHNKSETD